MLIARMAPRDRIDLVDVPCDERGERFLGIALDIFAQQDAVIQFLHLRVNATDAGKVTNFQAFYGRRPSTPACRRSGPYFIKCSVQSVPGAVSERGAGGTAGRDGDRAATSPVCHVTRAGEA